MKIYDFEQYSPDWWRVRRGIPTASRYGSILTAKTMKLAAAHDTYINELIGDLFDLEYGHKDEVANAAMRRGTAMEPESRNAYEMECDVDVRQVGFLTTDDGRFGCSPDGLIGADGGLELKNPSAHTHVAWLRAGGLPDDHRAQVHGSLIVSGRAWWDFYSYYPGLPSLRVRIAPDDYTAKLTEALEQFHGLYQAALAQFRPSQETAAA